MRYLIASYDDTLNSIELKFELPEFLSKKSITEYLKQNKQLEGKVYAFTKSEYKKIKKGKFAYYDKVFEISALRGDSPVTVFDNLSLFPHIWLNSYLYNALHENEKVLYLHLYMTKKDKAYSLGSFCDMESLKKFLKENEISQDNDNHLEYMVLVKLFNSKEKKATFTIKGFLSAYNEFNFNFKIDNKVLCGTRTV